MKLELRCLRKHTVSVLFIRRSCAHAFKFLEELTEDAYKDTTMICSLARDYITLFHSELKEAPTSLIFPSQTTATYITMGKFGGNLLGVSKGELLICSCLGFEGKLAFFDQERNMKYRYNFRLHSCTEIPVITL